MAFSRSKGSVRPHGGWRMPHLASDSARSRAKSRNIDVELSVGQAPAAEGAKQADAEFIRFRRRAPASQPAPHTVRPRRRLLNLRRRKKAGATGHGDPVHMDPVHMQEALVSAREKLEALEENGGVEGMNLEELDGLGSCAMAVLQLAEKGKDSARKREQAALSQEGEARAARDAAAAAELRRLEEENAELEQDNAELRETLSSERTAAVSLQYELWDFESEKEALRDELDSQGREMMALVSDKEFLSEELLSQGHELMELDSDKEALQSELDAQRREMMEVALERDTVHEQLEAEKEKLTCQICYARDRNTVILPCSHFQFCNSCVKQHMDRSRSCPTCRVTITGTMDLYVT